jgi:hypothetical protein
MVENRKNEYIQAFELANEWFEKNNDLNYLYAYNFGKKFINTRDIELALCIGEFLGKDIIEEYGIFELKNKDIENWDKEEIDTYIKCLKGLKK